MRNMLFTRLRLLLATLLLLPSLYSNAAPGKGGELTPAEFAEAITTNTGLMLLDVRTPEEFEQGTRLKGARCANWEAKDFTLRVQDINKKQAVYLYCGSGKRSHDAAAKMREMGFIRVYELKGGLQAWEADGREVTRYKKKNS